MMFFINILHQLWFLEMFMRSIAIVFFNDWRVGGFDPV